MPSIRQNAHSDVLPDFRNLGVIARLLVAVNAVAFVAALFAARDLAQAAERFVESATLLEPLLLAAVVVLAALSPALGRLAYPAGCVVVVAIVLALTAGARAALLAILGDAAALPDPGRMLVLAALFATGLLGYFYLLAKAYSPALAEARLQALQARIRPHFLFNSLNTVLSLIRRDPRRAERALEDLSDLFRTLMSDARQFVRLADEIALLERYAELEQMRLGERLRITWEIDAAPSDALLPPMVLQPLLENAVYHGVEPGTGPGEVLVRIERRGDRVLASIENPYIEEQQKRAGNRMALENIRERLMLFFDAEARIRTRAADSRFRVDIEIPYRSIARATAASLATPTEQE
jgi:two-component system sensor histidine kinase AlgZ